MAGLLGHPQPQSPAAISKGDLASSRCWGGLRARPACSEHPRRASKAVRTGNQVESGSPSAPRGSWPPRWSWGSGCGRYCGPPGAPDRLWGSCTPSQLGPAGRAEARTVSGSPRQRAHGEPAGHLCPRSGDPRRVLGAQSRVITREAAWWG